MKVTGNILGDMTGQLGKKIVAFTWKGIDCFRSYVIPANPDTGPQQTQRNLFSAVIAFAVGCLDSIINTYWNKWAIQQSPYNAFVKYNLLAWTNTTDFANAIVAKGSLFNPGITDAVYSATAVDFTFPDSLGGNGLATDSVGACVYDSSTGKWYTTTTTATRADEGITVTIDAGLTVGNLKGYLWFYRDLGTGNEDVSNSDYIQVTAP